MIHLVDHRDSFTWNVAHQLSPYGELCVVDFLEISKIDFSDSELIVFSPGPGEPSDYPESQNLYLECKGKIPILGVCLGFQLILASEGAVVIKQNRVLHGVQSRISFNKQAAIYQTIEEPLYVGRYHSLCIKEDTVPETFVVTAWDDMHKVPLSVEHIELPIFGFQYHPDSFLTNHGGQIIDNLFRELGCRAKSD